MKRIVIMGASSGIGHAAAKAYLAKGHRVALAARNLDILQQLKEEYPDRTEIARIDVNDTEAPRQLNELIRRLGGMDLYFHISGIGYENPSLDPNREAEVITTNTAGLARMVATAFDYFRDNGIRGGQIATVTSVAGTNGIGELAAYSASKKGAQTYLVALEQLAHNLHLDISFTDIRPGWIATPLLIPGRKYPMLMTLDQAMPKILRAVEQRKRVAVIGWRWKLLVALWRMLPNALWIRIPYGK